MAIAVCIVGYAFSPRPHFIGKTNIKAMVMVLTLSSTDIKFPGGGKYLGGKKRLPHMEAGQALQSYLDNLDENDNDHVQRE